MKFSSKLISGKILKRYKRFLADVLLPSGEVIVVHTPNTGSMATCWEAGWEVMLSKSLNEGRKYTHTLEMTNNGTTWIGINTHLPNLLVEESLRAQLIPEFSHLSEIKREVKLGDSRIDFVLNDKSAQNECFVEIKNVTLKGDNGCCQFPDAVSERGTKHLRLLMEKRRLGKRAVIFYVVQRGDVHTFSPASHIDPLYAQTLREAYHEGVEILVYRYKVSPTEIVLGEKLPFNLASMEA